VEGAQVERAATLSQAINAINGQLRYIRSKGSKAHLACELQARPLQWLMSIEWTA